MRRAKAPAGRVGIEVEEAAVLRLFQVVVHEANRIGRARGLTPDRCDDVVQETMGDLLGNPDLFRRYAEDGPTHALGPLLRFIANRVEREVARDKRYRSIPGFVTSRASHWDPEPDDPMHDAASLRRASLRRAVDDLADTVPGELRNFLLALLASSSAQRHAEKTGIALESVLKRLRRAAAVVRRSAGSRSTIVRATLPPPGADNLVANDRHRPDWWDDARLHALGGMQSREIAKLMARPVRTVRYALEQSRADSAAGAASIAKNGGRQ